jgi:hypothetical protein
MGRPAFVVEYVLAGNRSRMTPARWQGQANRDGRASQKNLAKHVAVLMDSTQPGGCNDHLSLDIVQATLRRNGSVDNEGVIAVWTRS